MPVLKDGESYIAHAGETQVDVSGDPHRMMMFDHSGPYYVPSSKTVIAYAFWKERKPIFSGFSRRREGSAPPRAEIGDRELLYHLM